MPISKENVVFVYRSGDSDSLSLAQTYQSQYDLEAEQLVSVPCSSTEILADEATFNSEILDPLNTALTTAPLSNRTVWVIILGYNVPGGFISGNDIVSSTSRISRIYHSFSKKKANYLYNRKIFSRFNGDDADFALIASRMDGRSSTTVSTMMEKTISIAKQNVVNGKFYIDPYSDRIGPQAEQYTTDILDFLNTTLSNLNLDVFSTQFIDPYVDSVIPSVDEDSFTWAWFTDRATSSFFRSTNTSRIFFYNADYDSAYTLRNNTSGRWSPLAIDAGYATLSGSLSNPTANGFLRPKPFFDALRRGATIGEAYMFSLPYLDWTNTFVGDPLLQITFPLADENPSLTQISVDEAWRLMSIDVAKTIAYLNSRKDNIETIRDIIVANTNISAAVDLLPISQKLSQINTIETVDAIVSNMVMNFLSFPVNYFKYDYLDLFKTLDQYLTDREVKISELITSTNDMFSDLSEDNLLDEGYWDIEFIIQDEAIAFTNYHFEVQVSDQEDFSNILFTADSSLDIDNWMFEEELGEFSDMSTSGVQSGFVGRKVRYSSKLEEYLIREQIYYARYRQRNSNGTWYSYTSLEDIAYT